MAQAGSYTVTSELLLRSNAAQVLTQVSRALMGLNTRITNVNTRLNGLTAALSTVGNNLTGVRAATQAMQAMQAGTAGASAAVQGATRSLNSNANALNRAAQAAQRATAALQSLSSVPPMSPVPPAPRGGGGAGGGAYGRHERYGEIAALGATGRGTLNRVGDSLVAAGSAQQAGTVMRASGVTPGERAAAEARAWEMTDLVRGSTMAENLQLIGQLRTTFETIDQAMQFAPAMASISQTLAGVTGRDPGRSGSYAARFLDAIDAFVDPETQSIDPARGMRLARMMENSIVMNQGTVTPEEFLNFAKQGRLAARRLDPSVMFGAMPAIIEGIGGHRTGTELSALYRQIVTGTMTQRVADQMVRYNLLNRDDVEVRRGGSVVVRPGSVAGADTFARNPVEWIQTVLMPRLQASGATTQDQQFEAISSLFGTETARGFVAQLIASMPQIQRNMRIYEQMPADAGRIVTDEGWNTALRNLQSSWTNLMTALGSAVLADAMRLMNGVADGLNGLAALVTQYPEAAAWFVGLAGGLGMLLTAGAAFAIGSLALGGLLSLGSAILVMAPYGAALAVIGTGLMLIYDAIDGETWQEKLATVRTVLLGWADAITGFTDRIFAIIERIRGAWAQGQNGVFPSLEGDTPANQAPGGAMGRFRENRDRLLREFPGMPEAIPQNFNPAPPAGGADAPTPVVLMLDGREVGRGVMPHLGREASGPIQSAARFDPRRAMQA